MERDTRHLVIRVVPAGSTYGIDLQTLEVESLAVSIRLSQYLHDCRRSEQ